MTNPKHTDTSRSGDLVELLRRKCVEVMCVERDAHCAEAADRIEALEAENERLRGYAAHTDECAINGWLPRGDEPCPPCTCGLTALIKEIEGD